jgi:hypothetical protein
MQQYSVHNQHEVTVGSSNGHFVIQKMSYKRRIEVLTMNGMLMSQLIMHISCYSEKNFDASMHLGEEDYTMQTAGVHN